MAIDDAALRAAADARQAWLDMLLLTTSLALAPCEWGACFVILWMRVAAGS
jgi:hypothetical protein